MNLTITAAAPISSEYFVTVTQKLRIKQTVLQVYIKHSNSFYVAQFVGMIHVENMQVSLLARNSVNNENIHVLLLPERPRNVNSSLKYYH